MKLVRWVAVLMVFSFAGIAFAADEAAKPVNQYLGAGKCKTCHNSAKKGAQFTKWAESKHANAYLVLASPKAIEIAKAKGLTNPQKAAECLECHVTGYNEPKDHFAASFSDSMGVQCESCHGAGSNYSKMATMKDITAKKADGAKFGLLTVTKDTCAKCHNERATGGKFVSWPADSAKIAHPMPPGAAAPAE